MPRRLKKAGRKPNRKYPTRARDVPVTQAMLYGVRDELNKGILALDRRADSYGSRFDSIELKLESHDKRFDSIDKRFDVLESKLDSKIEGVRSEVARIAVMVEEQNAKNDIVLEGLSGLFQRQNRVEKRVDEVEATIKSIARIRPGSA